MKDEANLKSQAPNHKQCSMIKMIKPCRAFVYDIEDLLLHQCLKFDIWDL